MPKAAVVYDLDQPMKIESVEVREPGEGEVYVRNVACGVCHSDLSVLNRVLPAPVPVVLGHEAAGVVEKVGPGVTDFAAGDHVVCLWRPSCRECRYCKTGRGHLCKLADDPTSRASDRITSGGKPIQQFLGVGGFSEGNVMSTNALARIDPAVPLERAALLGCAVITGFGAAEYGAKIKPGDEVAVFGCGGVGLNIIQGARHCGASVIVAVDMDESKFEHARRFGATHTLKADTPKLPKEIKEFTTERQGVDYAFDAVGSVKVTADAYLSVCRGGTVVGVGIARMSEMVNLPQLLTVMQEKTFKGSLAGSCDVCKTIPEMVGLYQEGELNLDDLVTKTYSIDEANQAMDDLREGRNARGVIVF